MTKIEFLDKLKKSLSNDFSSADVQGHVSYYSDYIDAEISRGRAEADVVAELGDPWVVARSLVNASADQMNAYESSGGYSNGGEYEDVSGYEESSRGSAYRNYGGNYGGSSYYSNEEISPIKRYLLEHPKALKALVIGGLILAVFVIFSIVMGIFSLIAPVLVPVIVIMFVFRLIRGDRRGGGGWI